MFKTYFTMLQTQNVFVIHIEKKIFSTFKCKENFFLGRF